MSARLPRVLAVIPARGGSKGLPGKNVKPLAGKPLIGWAADAARESGVVERLMLDTDSPEIARCGESLGIPVPWLRPAELARDGSPSIDFVLHDLDRLEAEGRLPEAVLLLQPTSPFRSAASIRRAVELYAASGTESLASVSPAAEHPWTCFFLEADGRLRRAAPDAPPVLRRQDLPPAYATDGAIYIDSPRYLRERKAFLGPETVAFLTPPGEELDIDTPEDWARAEARAARK
jgi:CMP-N,N'-diacetyllegionaminic acid synthase